MLQPLTIVRFVVSILLLSIALTAISAEDEDTPSGECVGRLIPGIEKMARGVDITELDLFPADLQQRNGFRKPVIDLTCLKKHKWTHPSIDVDTEYSKPDQVSGINTNSAGDMTAKMELTGESEDFKVSRLAKVGLDINTVAYGSFSASVSYKDAQENLYRGNQSLAETSATVSSIYIDFHAAPLLKLSEDFQYYLDLLSGPYESMPDLYDSLITTFGTHYFETATLGGYIYQKTLLNEAYTMDSTETEIKANLKASFWVVTATGEAEEAKKRITDRFKKSSESHIVFFGGSPVAINPKEPAGKFLETWVPTVNRDPWLFGGQLKPIEDLILNGTLRSQVKIAIEVKKARAYLAEVKHLIDIGQFRLDSQETEKLGNIEEWLTTGSGKIHLAVRYLDEIQDTVQQIRDRALMEQLVNHIYVDNPGLKCKDYALDCTSYEYRSTAAWQGARSIVDGNMAVRDKLVRRIDDWMNTATRGPRNSTNSRLHLKALELQKEAREMVEKHQSTVIDLCSGSWKATCDGCSYLNSQCTDAENRKLINWK